MLYGKDIIELVELLEARNASLFHACQFTDFEAYLRLGGIPSREFLEQNQENFTSFDTDEIDHANGVWSKVFVNLSDFGCIFAHGGSGVPNPYGPILLQIRPAALRKAADVAVCLRSAGSKGFDRQQEALSTIGDVDRLFSYASGVGFPQSTRVKYGEELQALKHRAANPEVSCTILEGFIPICDVIVAWIDPYEIGEQTLFFWVKEAMDSVGVDFPVWVRSCHEERRPLYEELLKVVNLPSMSLEDIAYGGGVTLCLRTWAEKVLQKDLDYQFLRYACYLTEGTVRPLLD